MKERKLLTDFNQHIKTVDDVAWYRLGDVFGGYTRPDVIAFWKGYGFIFEFKIQGQKLKPEQEKMLSWFVRQGGVKTFVANFYMQPGGKHCRNIRFLPYYADGIGEAEYLLKYERGGYPGIAGLFPALSLLHFVNAVCPNTIEK